MSDTPSGVKSAGARVGLHGPNRHDNPAQLAEARRDLAAERIADAIRKAVADAPPLTAEQKAELAALLWGAA